jgi:integrase
MASVHKRPRSRYWAAAFTLSDGTRCYRSTKETSRKLAQQIADHWEHAATIQATETQARKVLSDIVERIHGDKVTAESFSDYKVRWLATKEKEAAPPTFAHYSTVMKEFASFLGDRASRPLHHITPRLITEYRDIVATRSAARTANNKLKVLRTFLQSAWRDGLIPENPAAKVVGVRAVDSRRRPFTLPELRLLLRHANGEWRGLIVFGLYTGQRLKDVASLTWANIDTERGEIRLQTSKTGRQQIIPMHRVLVKHLELLPSADTPEAPLFPSAYLVAARRRDTSALSQQFHGILVSAGLAKPRPEKWKPTGAGRNARRVQNEVTFHSLRHTATSLLKQAGVGEAVARDIIGHESAAVSRHYTSIDEHTKRAAVAKLPDLHPA